MQDEFDDVKTSLTYEEQGSKLAVLSTILMTMNIGEKMVIVSIFTQVLDLIAELCSNYDYPFLRLDGSTSSTNRQTLVNNFNSPQSKYSILLLSSKAGGTGKLFIYLFVCLDFAILLIYLFRYYFRF